MNRREFLQSLAAIGTSLAIPLDALSKATTAEIDTAWQALVAEPRIFYVSSYGALSSTFGSSNRPCSRMELLCLGIPPTEPTGLRGYIESEWRIESHVENLFEDAEAAGEVGAATDWQAWLATGGEEVQDDIRRSVEEWLDEDGDGSDWEHADLSGLSGRGDAMEFFRRERETADLLDVVIIEGEHPGSTYFAAELRMEMAAANALAERHGMPIRFEHDED